MNWVGGARQQLGKARTSRQKKLDAQKRYFAKQLQQLDNPQANLHPFLAESVNHDNDGFLAALQRAEQQNTVISAFRPGRVARGSTYLEERPQNLRITRTKLLAQDDWAGLQKQTPSPVHRRFDRADSQFGRVKNHGRLKAGNQPERRLAADGPHDRLCSSEGPAEGERLLVHIGDQAFPLRKQGSTWLTQTSAHQVVSEQSQIPHQRRPHASSDQRFGLGVAEERMQGEWMPSHISERARAAAQRQFLHCSRNAEMMDPALVEELGSSFPSSISTGSSPAEHQQPRRSRLPRIGGSGHPPLMLREQPMSGPQLVSEAASSSPSSQPEPSAGHLNSAADHVRRVHASRLTSTATPRGLQSVRRASNTGSESLPLDRNSDSEVVGLIGRTARDVPVVDSCQIHDNAISCEEARKNEQATTHTQMETQEERIWKEFIFDAKTGHCFPQAAGAEADIDSRSESGLQREDGSAQSPQKWIKPQVATNQHHHQPNISSPHSFLLHRLQAASCKPYSDSPNHNTSAVTAADQWGPFDL